MPFYVKNNNGKLRVLEHETVISRRPSKKKIAVLVMPKDKPDEMHIKALDHQGILIKSGPGFKQTAMSEAVIKQGDFIIHDQQTNDMVVVIFSKQAIFYG